MFIFPTLLRPFLSNMALCFIQFIMEFSRVFIYCSVFHVVVVVNSTRSRNQRMYVWCTKLGYIGNGGGSPVIESDFLLFFLYLPKLKLS